MPLEYWKPSKSGKGSATSWSVNSKEESVFVQIVKQSDSFGSPHPFQTGDKATVQLKVIEIGQILNVLNGATEYKTVHESDKFSTNISFSQYWKENEKKVKFHAGYGFTINRQEKGKEERKSFLIGYNFGEAETLRQWLKFALDHIFTAIYSADKKKAEDYKKQQKVTPEVVPTPDKLKEPAPEGDIEL